MIKEAEMTRKQLDKDCVARGHKNKELNISAELAAEAPSQEAVQEARNFAKMEQTKAACDYDALEALEAEAAAAAAHVTVDGNGKPLFDTATKPLQGSVVGTEGKARTAPKKPSAKSPVSSPSSKPAKSP